MTIELSMPGPSDLITEIDAIEAFGQRAERVVTHSQDYSLVENDLFAACVPEHSSSWNRL
jgi:hypothetical protein